MALVHAARYPSKIRSLDLAGAPSTSMQAYVLSCVLGVSDNPARAGRQKRPLSAVGPREPMTMEQRPTLVLEHHHARRTPRRD
jgi:hypothetical protein